MRQRDLDALLYRVYELLWRDLIDAFRQAQSGRWLRVVERLLLDRDIEGSFRAIGLRILEDELSKLPERLQPLRNAAWARAAEELPKELRSEAFAQLSMPRHMLERPEVLQAIAAQDLTRIRGISRETEAAIREVITRGLQEGVHPRKLAREIRPLIGLTRRQAAAVQRYRAKLEAENRATDQIDRMTERYANRQLRQRAETIARTEVIRAQSDGRRLQWERLIAEGRLRYEDWEQEWVTARDERTCPVCAPMHGQRRPIGGLFDSGVGPVAGPPVHPNCRCVTRLVRAGFRSGENPAPARDTILRGL